MLNAILSRWKQRVVPALRRPAAADSSTGLSTTWTGTGPAPRSGARNGDSLLQSILRWLPGEADPWGAKTRPPEPSPLPLVRADFHHALFGLQGVDELAQSIRRARGLRDFWHLRSWIYTEVARAYDQAEAEARLQALDRHFSVPGVPGTSGTSGSAALAGLQPPPRSRRH